MASRLPCLCALFTGRASFLPRFQTGSRFAGGTPTLLYRVPESGSFLKMDLLYSVREVPREIPDLLFVRQPRIPGQDLARGVAAGRTHDNILDLADISREFEAP